MDLQQISNIQDKLDLYTENLLDIKESLLNKEEVGKELKTKYQLSAMSLYLVVKEDVAKALSGQDNEEMEVMKKTYIRKLIAIICDLCTVTEEELYSNASVRRRDLVVARQFHMAFLHKTFGMSQEKAAYVYRKHPATVVHSYKTIRDLYQTDKSFLNEYRPIFDHCLRYDELICSKRTQTYLDS